jgi:hypothetical protein
MVLGTEKLSLSSQNMFLGFVTRYKSVPDPGGKKGTGSRIRNTAFHCPFLNAGAAAVTPSSGSSWSRQTGWAMRPPPQRIRIAARRGDRWVGGEALKGHERAVLRIRDPGSEPLDPGNVLFRISNLGSQNQTIEL